MGGAGCAQVVPALLPQPLEEEKPKPGAVLAGSAGDADAASPPARGKREGEENRPPAVPGKQHGHSATPLGAGCRHVPCTQPVLAALHQGSPPPGTAPCSDKELRHSQRRFCENISQRAVHFYSK